MRYSDGVRTTLDIDEDVLETARELAAMQRVSIGKVISDSARRSLWRTSKSTEMRNGVPLLSPRKGTQIVTLEVVNRLRDDDLTFTVRHKGTQRLE